MKTHSPLQNPTPPLFSNYACAWQSFEIHAQCHCLWGGCAPPHPPATPPIPTPCAANGQRMEYVEIIAKPMRVDEKTWPDPKTTLLYNYLILEHLCGTPAQKNKNGKKKNKPGDLSCTVDFHPL